MRPPHLFRYTSHAFRGPIRNSTDGPKGCFRMLPPDNFWHTPHTFRGSKKGAPPNAEHTATVLTTAYGWVLRQANVTCCAAGSGPLCPGSWGSAGGKTNT
eukprot:1632201-Pyramimonas_sp.AAC.1